MKPSRMQNNRKDSVTEGRNQCRPAASPVALRRICTIASLLVLISLSGCRSLRPADGEGLFAGSDLLNTSAIRGPLERALKTEEDALTRGEKFSPEALRQLEAARKQFDAGKYQIAVTNYKTIANRYPESSIGEEARFRMGECHYAMHEYPKAQDAFDKLFKDYPSTKYVADASDRMFSIAKIWLDVSDPVAKTKIKTVSSSTETKAPETQGKSSGSLSARYGLIPNFFDKTRPVFDTRGRAREALKAIWLNDPTGPLADDALMLTASYYLRQGNNLEADRYFEILREEYPDSPHLEDAFVLGAHVKQMSYQGPFYDGTTLVSAENLKQRTLTLFPNSDDRQQVREDLNKLYLLKAQRAWSQVELWKRKGNPRAIAIQCMQLINEFPETQYAERARGELRRIDPGVVRNLPGMTAFMESLPKQPSRQPNTNDAASKEQPIKSVSDSKPQAPNIGL